MADNFFGKSDFQFVQLDEEFEPLITSLSNQTYGHNVGIKTKLNLREVILMDSQLRMDLFYNRALLENTAKSKTKIRLKINLGMIKVYHQATVNGYHKSLWFSENAINNIIVLVKLCL